MDIYVHKSFLLTYFFNLKFAFITLDN